MNQILIAVTFVAGLSGIAMTTAAFADDFSGVGQHPKAYTQDATPDMTSTGPVLSATAWNDDVTTKSHGHP